MANNGHELQTLVLGALPIINAFFAELHLEPILDRYVPSNDRRLHVPHAQVLLVLLRNIIIGRRPLYALSEWSKAYSPTALGIDGVEAAAFTDDRAGRALDALFDADRASLLTEVITRAIQAFEINLERFHNDSTSITFSGEYAAALGRTIRGKRALRVTWGHNKDHRPDLKQLLWSLTVSSDGAVPVHYRVHDGNTSDDPTHIDTWNTIRRLVGRPNFVYVADSKLCTKPNMDYIDSQGGRFITVLPRSRREDSWFREYLQTNSVEWETVESPNRRGSEEDEEESTWRVTEAPQPSAEGYRVIWIFSAKKARRDARIRQAAIEESFAAVQELERKLQSKRSRMRERKAVDEAIDKILRKAGAQRWVEVEVVERTESTLKQAEAGRPGPDTRYIRKDRLRFSVKWRAKDDLIRYDARSDGMYPLITNDKQMHPANALRNYKYQPQLEKRHQQLKTVYLVAPVFLKNEGRAEALLLLYFLAMLVQALIEREVRTAMDTAGLDAMPLYPEKRECVAPTANRILEVFEGVQRHEVLKNGAVMLSFPPALTDLHRQLLHLLGLDEEVYASPEN